MGVYTLKASLNTKVPSANYMPTCLVSQSGEIYTVQHVHGWSAPGWYLNAFVSRSPGQQAERGVGEGGRKEAQKEEDPQPAEGLDERVWLAPGRSRPGPLHLGDRFPVSCLRHAQLPTACWFITRNPYSSQSHPAAVPGRSGGLLCGREQPGRR